MYYSLYSPFTSKNICWLCFCLHHRKKPNPTIRRQMHPRLVPNAKAILWLLGFGEGGTSYHQEIQRVRTHFTIIYWRKKQKQEKGFFHFSYFGNYLMRKIVGLVQFHCILALSQLHRSWDFPKYWEKLKTKQESSPFWNEKILNTEQDRKQIFKPKRKNSLECLGKKSWHWTTQIIEWQIPLLQQIYIIRYKFYYQN